MRETVRLTLAYLLFQSCVALSHHYKILFICHKCHNLLLLCNSPCCWCCLVPFPHLHLKSVLIEQVYITKVVSGFCCPISLCTHVCVVGGGRRQTHTDTNAYTLTHVDRQADTHTNPCIPYTRTHTHILKVNRYQYI